MLNACTKETATPISTKKDMALQIKEYYPPETVDVTEKVVNFLNHTKTYNPNASFKTEFKDMEMNEAMWTLEAAANYLVNKNMIYKMDEDNEVFNYNLEFELQKKDNNLKINGKDLTAKFEQLMSKINTKAKANSKLPKLVDFYVEKHKSQIVSFKINVSLVTDELIQNQRKYDAFNYTDLCDRIPQLFDHCTDYLSYPTFTTSTNVNSTAILFKRCVTDAISSYMGGSYVTNVNTWSFNPVCEALNYPAPIFDSTCGATVTGRFCQFGYNSYDMLEILTSNGLQVINDHVCAPSSIYSLIDIDQGRYNTTSQSHPDSHFCGGTTQDNVAIKMVWMGIKQ